MYELFFTTEALAELRAIEPVVDRRRLAAALQLLSVEPDAPGFGDAVDAGGRVNRVGVIGPVAFAYWTDHALKRVRILAVKSMAE